MNCEHILRHQPKEVRGRAVRLSFASICYHFSFIITSAIFPFLLFCYGLLVTAVNLFVLCTAITSYFYSALLKQQEHIIKITDTDTRATVGLWDENHKDHNLFQLLTHEINGIKLDTEIYLESHLHIYTLMNIYTVLICYINYRYYTYIVKFAGRYEGMIKKLSKYPYIIQHWEAKCKWEKANLKVGYPSKLKDILNIIINKVAWNN